MNYKTEKGKELMLYPHGLSLPEDKLPSDNALKIIQEAISYLELMDEPQGSGCIFFNDDYYCQKTPGGKGYAWCVTYLWDIFRMCGLSHLFYDGGRVNILDPCGLIADGKSSARDVALILRAAMQIPVLRRIMTTAFYVLPHFNDSVMNTNRLINPIYDVVNYCPYCVGGKTGTSRVAGLCFSSLFERNGKEYIAVVLGENFRLHPSGERMFAKVCKDHVLRIFENTGRFIHISLPEHYFILEVGEHCLLSPKVLKNTIDEEIVFSYHSFDENVATVNETGEVTIVGKGIAQIAVMTQTGDYDICFVNSSGSEVFNMCRQSIAGLKSEADTKDKVKE